MTSTQALVTKAMIDELVARFGSQFTPEEIEECVYVTAYDLKGSIAVESLPEMATRLAVVRLAHRPQTLRLTRSAS